VLIGGTDVAAAGCIDFTEFTFVVGICMTFIGVTTEFLVGLLVLCKLMSYSWS